MAIYDVSVGVSRGMPVWPGDPAVNLERVERISEGSNANVSRLACSVHTGTHVDAPLHFVDGMYGVDQMPLEDLIGDALVVDFEGGEHIDAGMLDAAGIPLGTRRLLLKTRNSEFWAEPEHNFHRDFVAIEPDGAQWVVDRGLRLVGVDYLSVAPFGRSTTTHRILLGAGIIVVEGMNLSAVPPGEYELVCLPLKLMGSDGAPARAILRGR
jgi:arylformamidase